MEIIIGKLSGFCPGVLNAVNMATEILEKNNNQKNIYCLGEIVHNRQVVEHLEKKGMITVKNIEDIPNKSTVIFRAHGESEKIYEIAKNKELEIVDLTCWKVKTIHSLVKKHKDKEFIIIIGKKEHPEVIGTKGFSGPNSFIIESEEDILDAYIEYEKTNLPRVYVVSQTTISSNYFDKLSKSIEENFAETEVIIEKTVCSATEKRQEEADKISKIVNSMIIIGGKNSSNTKELAKISQKNCQDIHLIETVKELENIDFSKYNKIGIMAGASTPGFIIDEVKLFLEKI